MPPPWTSDFVGCKLLLCHGTQVLTYLRDDKPGLPWAGMWDLPGGGREGSESPQDCVLREFHEEFGLHLPPARLIWHREFPAMIDPARRSHFFAGWLQAEEIDAITFGDEGQVWQMMPLADWLSHPLAVPDLQARSRLALTELGWPP